MPFNDDLQAKLRALGLLSGNSYSSAQADLEEPDTSEDDSSKFQDMLDFTEAAPQEAVEPVAPVEPVKPIAPVQGANIVSGPKAEAAENERAKALSGEQPSFPDIPKSGYKPSEAEKTLAEAGEPIAPEQQDIELPGAQITGMPPKPQSTVSNVSQSTPAMNFQDYAAQLANNPELNDEALARAQKIGNLQRLGAGIAEGFDSFGQLAAGKQFDRSFYKGLQDNADKGVENIKERRDALTKNMTAANMAVEMATKNLSLQREQRLNDPNSSESAAIRNMVTRFEPKLAKDPEFQKMSGKDVKDFMLHFLETEGRLQYMKAAGEKKAQEHSDVQAQKYMKDFTDRMNPDAKGFNNQVRKNIDLAQSADRAQAVLDTYKDPQTGKYNIPPERLGDLNLSVVNLLTGGKTTVHALKSITPSNVKLDSAHIMEWLTGNPHGAEQTKWMEDYQGLLNRENKISKEYVRNYFDQQLESAKRNPLYHSNPDYFSGLHGDKVKQYNLGEVESRFDEKDKNQTPPPAGAPGAKGEQIASTDKDMVPGGQKVPALPAGMVKVRNKKSGKEKIMSAEKADKYLKDPKHGADFEQVQ